MFDEVLRQVIIIAVWTVLVLRTPWMVRDRRQLPLWVVLVEIAAGSILIQSWFGTAINAATGIPQFNNLFQGLWAVLDVAVTLEFVAHLAHDGAGPWRRWRVAAAVGTAAGMVLLFALSPRAELFVPQTRFSPFTAYTLLTAVYLIGASVAAAWIMGRHLPRIHGRTLRVGLLMVTVGAAAEVPFMIIRVLQRLTPFATPELLKTALLFSSARFILVPLGCAIAAAEPIRKAVLYCVRRARIYSLWRMLRSATGTITLAPLVSRHRDALAVNDAWERLHRRVIEIRDSIFHLHDTQAWPELLARSQRNAQAVPDPERRRLVEIASWLEVTRRAALADAPKPNHELDKTMLPELLADESTVRTEVRYLLRLHKTMRSEPVRTFADTVGSLPQ